MRNRVFTILFILISSYCFANDCYWGGNFIKSAKYSKLIVKGKVIGKYYHFEDEKIISQSNKSEFEEYIFKKEQDFFKSIKIEIIEIIKGKEKRKIIEIFGSNGNDLKSGVSNFEKGKFYIFSLHNTISSEYNLPNEGKNDFHIDGCSENYLEYFPESNQVYGYIKGKSNRKKKRKYSYEKLKRKIT